MSSPTSTSCCNLIFINKISIHSYKVNNLSVLPLSTASPTSAPNPSYVASLIPYSHHARLPSSMPLPDTSSCINPGEPHSRTSYPSTTTLTWLLSIPTFSMSQNAVPTTSSATTISSSLIGIHHGNPERLLYLVSLSATSLYLPC